LFFEAVVLGHGGCNLKALMASLALELINGHFVPTSSNIDTPTARAVGVLVHWRTTIGGLTAPPQA
jgi:hypothetical protein